MVSSIRLSKTIVIAIVATTSLVGCMSPTTALKIASGKNEIHHLGTGKPALDFNLINESGLTKEQITRKEEELYTKALPAIQKYDSAWINDFQVATEQVKQQRSVAPLIALEAKTQEYDKELSASLTHVGLKGTNSWLFPNGKGITRVELVRELTVLCEKALENSCRASQEINNSREFAGNVAGSSLAILGAVAVAAAQNPIPQPNYVPSAEFIPQTAPTSATTYVNGGPQYGGYTATTIFH